MRGNQATQPCPLAKAGGALCGRAEGGTEGWPRDRTDAGREEARKRPSGCPHSGGGEGEAGKALKGATQDHRVQEPRAGA